eukprot:gnl/Spiro4/17992_TR9599_c0_g1_i2.p1 gnl/Spiro4/17992_TR9599_c0_g1~~gnl/Spiro4/17992_TR9599_c0_g1_i2.p1  ORF type:complete len:368 (+),score=52.91 gnl/Spiro4/17992_TR9599_c0_g1_i2:123-1226(+)
MRVVEVCVVLCAVFALRVVRAEPPHKIVFNGDFDLLRFAITHDEENVYAYLMARGDISRTSQVGKDGQTTAGRSYIQVAMDIDNDYSTGYCLCEGGYYPNACGYDIQFELEMYNGTFNTAHYLLHAMVNESQLTEARFLAIHKGEVFLAPAHYDVLPTSPSIFSNLPLSFVWDICTRSGCTTTRTPSHQRSVRGAPTARIHFRTEPLSVLLPTRPTDRGIMDHAFDEARHQVEIKAPYRGFLNRNGKPVLGLGQKVTVVMMLEGSGEYSSPNSWCTDAAYPIRGYVFEPPPPAPALPQSTAQPQKQPQQTRPAAEELARLFFHSIGELMKNPVFVCLMITTALLMILHAVGSKQSRTTVASSNSAAV